jgi:hypothetical protein
MLSPEEMAYSIDLWREYVDPDVSVSDNEFALMSFEERVSLAREVFDSNDIY